MFQCIFLHTKMQYLRGIHLNLGNKIASSLTCIVRSDIYVGKTTAGLYRMISDSAIKRQLHTNKNNKV